MIKTPENVTRIAFRGLQHGCGMHMTAQDFEAVKSRLEGIDLNSIQLWHIVEIINSVLFPIIEDDEEDFERSEAITDELCINFRWKH